MTYGDTVGACLEDKDVKGVRGRRMVLQEFGEGGWRGGLGCGSGWRGRGGWLGFLGFEEIKGWLILFFSDNVLYIYS